MVICLGRGANLHVAQLIPPPLTISCYSKSRLVLPFWYQLTRIVVDKEPLNGSIQQKDQRQTAGMRCTVTEGSYVSVGQSEKQTVKYVKNSELKRICYKEPLRGNSDWSHMQDGGQQEVKDTDVRNCRRNE